MDAPASPAQSSGVTGQIARLAAPLAAVHLGQVAMGLVDTAFVGRVGKEALAAVALGNSVFFTLTILGMGLVLGAEPVISQAVGAGDAGRARRSLFEAVAMALLATLPVLGLLVLALWLLPLAGIDAEVVRLTREYALARGPGLPGFLLFIALKGYLQAHGRTRAILISIVVANLVNVPADLLLIFGDEGLRMVGLSGVGLPGFGVLGAGIATSLASWSRCLIVLPGARELLREAKDAVVDEIGVTAQGLWRIARIGAPIGLQMALEVAVFSLVSLLMGRLGPGQLAAHQVAISLASVPFNVTLGIGSATSVVVGKRIGALDRTGTLRAGLSGIGLGVGVMLVSGTLFVAVPDLFVRVFTDDVGVLVVAVGLVRVAGAFALSDGVQAVASGALRGAGDTAWPFGIHLVAHWLVGMPAALVFGFALDGGPVGLWWGLTAGLTFAAAALSLRFFLRARRGYEAIA